MHENELLSVGDTVNWRGGWGRYIPLPVKITGISLQGTDSTVESVPWNLLTGREVVVDLDNGHWAYGEQLDHYEGGEASW